MLKIRTFVGSADKIGIVVCRSGRFLALGEHILVEGDVLVSWGDNLQVWVLDKDELVEIIHVFEANGQVRLGDHVHVLIHQAIERALMAYRAPDWAQVANRMLLARARDLQTPRRSRARVKAPCSATKTPNRQPAQRRLAFA